MSELLLSGVTAGYAGRPVLRGLSCGPIPHGRVTALVGPNAAGKSTLLRAIAGLVRAKGSIRFGDRELIGMSARERAHHLAFMPQALPQDTALSVIEALLGAWRALPDGASWGSEAALLDRVGKVLDRLGLGDLGMAQLQSLSGGQRQMVALAQAIIRDPPLLLLDEPTSALDLRRQLEVMGLLGELAREGRTVIVVLHDLALAARWADCLLVMDHGEAHGFGPSETVLTPGMLDDVYGVEARIEPCSQGRRTLLIDGVSRRAPPP
ncbi:ABC transporter ATP-binding protein [Roseomonas eburnea]|uniref:ABC transporter ATP-binding protein n=1 Tax=Neoroseomonas eburnea TaxID=1346889 RepID=A0A9X9X9S7_9PROT|nr:ABC transporter ATP-binding protein [Neoroseomonas eburnea]MBR0680463.1 ABC transporter ATP-binding protein [Neoroseomonas eburnea]